MPPPPMTKRAVHLLKTLKNKGMTTELHDFEKHAMDVATKYENDYNAIVRSKFPDIKVIRDEMLQKYAPTTAVVLSNIDEAKERIAELNDELIPLKEELKVWEKRLKEIIASVDRDVDARAKELSEFTQNKNRELIKEVQKDLESYLEKCVQ